MFSILKNENKHFNPFVLNVKISCRIIEIILLYYLYTKFRGNIEKLFENTILKLHACMRILRKHHRIQY